MESPSSEFRAELGNIKESVKHGAEAAKRDLSRTWNDRYHAVQDRTREAVDASEEFVKAHPFYTVLGAATVGFVAGMLIRRKH
ncbi:MAG: DUF883 family protein [Bdellovibrio sp.]|uniref:DUF883 family protein n=1 Tax=Bdellovibrio sp. TaxID=28201 RepID=UPI0039E63363|nr:DUF883 family protein [Bdellovibrio sp.]